MPVFRKRLVMQDADRSLQLSYHAPAVMHTTRMYCAYPGDDGIFSEFVSDIYSLSRSVMVIILIGGVQYHVAANRATEGVDHAVDVSNGRSIKLCTDETGLYYALKAISGF